jgi:glutaconate CoA-transferase subunit A
MMRHMESYVAQVNAEPVRGMRDYLDRYVFAPKSWPEFLALIGMEEVLEATSRGRSIYND